MASTDAFALKNSGLNDFLFSGVGTELNGSTLTILSVLARLGKDPWAQAAEWAGTPQDTVIDRVAESIAQMPLVPSALAEARATAARITLLLPSLTQASRSQARAAASGSPMPRWLPLTLFYCLLALALALNASLGPKAAPTTAVPTTQTIDHPP